MQEFCKSAAIAAVLFAGSSPAWATEKTLPAKTADASPKNRESGSTESKKFADYRTWKPISDEPIKVPAERSAACAPRAQLKDPHSGGFVAIYVNPTGRKSYLSETRGTFAEGTVIVKEKLRTKDADQPEELGVMVKMQKGFDREAGDWQFLFVDKDKELTKTRSQLTNCIECHRRQAAADYVFGQPKVDRGNKRSY
jgi:cytochrome c553